MHRFITAKQKDYEIKEPSQELLWKVLETFPLKPEYFELNTRAGMVARFDTFQGKEEKEKQVNKYIDDCIKNEIIPFSEIYFNYSNDSHFYRPRSSLIGKDFIDFTNCPENRRKEVGQAMIKGGKIDKFSFSARIPSITNVLDAFKQQWLNPLKGSGYVINHLDIWASSYHLTGYNQGDYPKVRLGFSWGNLILQGIYLEDNGLDEKDTSTLDSWFGKIKGDSLKI